MVYKFPDAGSPKYIDLSVRRAKDKFAFQENIVIAIVNGIANSNPDYFAEFASTKARKIWEIAAYLTEEREHRIPRHE